MNTSINFRNNAAKAAIARPELAAALGDWHKEITERGVTKEDFDTWLRHVIDNLAANFKDGIEPSVEWMVNALKVQCGFMPSVRAVMERDKKSFVLDKADLNSYIEDCMVNAAVWYKGKNAYAAAESTKDFFEANGWAVEVWKDEDREDDYTVNATRDFDGKEVA